MSYESWSSLLKIVGYAGALFVLISTVGLGVVNEQLDKVKDAKIDDLVSGKNALLQSAEQYKKQAEEKQKQIDELKAKAANASRGITKFREFSGVLRETRAGFSAVRTGNSFEESIFPTLEELANTHRWTELDSLCTEGLTKSSNWMTLFFFRGLARLNLAQLDLARHDLETVLDNVGDSPDYAQANNWLQAIANQRAGQS
ncbi:MULTISPECIES: hypothetical protein [unclassified Pseudomonas]|uniref:hypothetical protein n=1 Tax=unclassified Pseudomonas TaxID=196821 RepID=UPI00177B0E31|nr:hypothetical protein [Pseudomonas sp. CFBP 8772]MBD8597333.1 hypothetical protein [Pseudomonas sp. CFBP 8772]